MQEDELKVVLLDYLRKNRPDDTDIFSKVATHYNMWRELASVLEKQADKELKVLKTHAVGKLFASLESCAIRKKSFFFSLGYTFLRVHVFVLAVFLILVLVGCETRTSDSNHWSVLTDSTSVFVISAWSYVSDKLSSCQLTAFPMMLRS